MSLLLHLSDLHLGNTADEDLVGDYKVEAIREEDRNKRTTLLRSTLHALAGRLREDGDRLDALLVTGDVTTQGRTEGFDVLSELLEALGDRLPPADRVVVVPGNHDVAWHTSSGSADRYQAFVDGVRAAGYVTPLLDGVDYDADQPLAGAQPLLVGDDFVVIAVNSADASGLLEPLPPAVHAELDRLVRAGDVTADFESALRRIRTYDMSRISARQMAALSHRLEAVDPSKVRIAALHHQLLPVSEEEEAKAFESMINLGAFLAFLGSADVDLVAHGHKHVEAVLPLALTGSDGRPRQAIVSSCGTIGGPVGVGREIARLVRVDSSLPTLRRLRVTSVPAVGPGTTRIPRPSLRTVHNEPTWREEVSPVALVGGRTATDVHEKLLELGRARASRPVRDVVCVVQDGGSAIAAPASYPWPGQPAELAGWFKDIVSWWQDEKRAPGKPFTHGQRLKDWPPERNQIDAMATILGNKRSTSRAIAVLVDPVSDLVEDASVDFPSFSVLHLWISGDQLHCTAFFRKQEMNYWWAINASEIAAVQRAVLQRLWPSNETLTAGSIRTYASEAVFSDRLPKVNVPLIDRVAWDDPQALQVLAVAVADMDLDGREGDLMRVQDLLSDWAPDEAHPPVDGAPVPAYGLGVLSRAVGALADRYSDSPARTAATLLEDLAEANERYVGTRDSAEPNKAYADWRRRVQPKLDQLTALLLPEDQAGR